MCYVFKCLVFCCICISFISRLYLYLVVFQTVPVHTVCHVHAFLDLETEILFLEYTHRLNNN